MQDITSLIEQASGLRNEVPTVLTQTSAEVVKGEIAQRKLLRVRLREAKGQISKEIANLRALKGELDVMDQYLGTDVERLDDYKWELIRGERDAQSPHGAHPDFS